MCFYILLEDIMEIGRVMWILSLLSLLSFGYAEELTLNQLKNRAIQDSTDVQIAYEEYYQAQQQIKVSLGHVVPRIDIEAFRSGVTIGVLDSLLPTPSDWFVYKGSQDLAQAEKYAGQAIWLNIQLGLAKNYYALKFQEKNLIAVTSIKQMYEEILSKLRPQIGIGNVEPILLYEIERKILNYKQQEYLIRETITRQYQVLNVLLKNDPENELTFADMKEKEIYKFPEDWREASEIGLDHSPEVMQSKYLYRASLKTRKSKSWDFINFQGVGFDYFSNVKIARSESRVLKLEEEKTRNRITNQVFSIYEEMNYLLARLANSESFVTSQRHNFGGIESRFQAHLVPAMDYGEAKEKLILAEIDHLGIIFEKLVKEEELARLLNYRPSLFIIPQDIPLREDMNIEVLTYSRQENGKERVRFYLSGVELDQVDSFKVLGLEDEYMTNRARNNFKLRIYRNNIGNNIPYEIVLKTGDIIHGVVEL